MRLVYGDHRFLTHNKGGESTVVLVVFKGVGCDIESPFIGASREILCVILRVIAIVIAEKYLTSLVVASVIRVVVTIPIVAEADCRCIVWILNPHLDRETA